MILDQLENSSKFWKKSSPHRKCSDVKTTSPLKKVLKKVKNKVRRVFKDTDFGLHPDGKPEKSLSKQECMKIIDRLGLKSGDFVFVQHSLGNLNLDFNANEFVEMLKERIGNSGNIVMQGTSFLGRAAKYLESKPIFDVDFAPCRLGLLGEIFRRSEGVYRSIHPIGSVCVWGKDAEQLAGLLCKDYGVGTESIYGYGDTVNAKIVGLGVDINSMAPMHYVEYLAKDHYPIFTKRKYPVTVKCNNEEITWETYAYNPKLCRKWRGILNTLVLLDPRGRFIANNRVYYCFTFKTLKDASQRLMKQKTYFR